MGFEWPDWALAHLIGVEPHEVREVLGMARRWPRPADDGNVTVLSIWARSAGGRALIVVTRQVDQWTWLIVGAREMRAQELTEFEKWEQENR
ncbi:hypothetical protein NDR87_00810 [Nocardia sp. CDC159]|uniref:Uncharacterized protein n=1 Tax=Nocardia pulmonis TaxID=2951408 RepID=A0A9X2IU34_9NOCA|nr:MULTISPECIES: hypothetical protein [Nocardia]MCM6772447.1 hypothetical protein [Nocardia pulmonis]MCM6784895.1 hypothetical protein [Nocardia sp. CDC159]